MTLLAAAVRLLTSTVIAAADRSGVTSESASAKLAVLLPSAGLAFAATVADTVTVLVSTACAFAC